MPDLKWTIIPCPPRNASLPCTELQQRRSFEAVCSGCVLQLGGTARIPAGGTATIELAGPDARALNNPGYYKHSAESQALANVGSVVQTHVMQQPS